MRSCVRVVTFLAMLELIRLKQLIASQATPFGEIELVQPPPSCPPPFNPAEAYATAVVQETGPAPAAVGPPEAH